MGKAPSFTTTARAAAAETGLLAGRVAVVTGASGGIGRAVALALSGEGASLCAVGRDRARLSETVTDAQRLSLATSFQMDLTREHDYEPLVGHIREAGRLDILIHCAGTFRSAPLEFAALDDLDLQLAVNVRGPYLLTQRLLPLLAAPGGQIVFVNSSAGLSAGRADVGQYSATKHALKAIADSLREELNPRGVRVLSVYLGRTATPMQKAIFRREERTYRPELLMQPGDVASVVVHALTLPFTAEITDISMRPMRKSY